MRCRICKKRRASVIDMRLCKICYEAELVRIDKGGKALPGMEILEGGKYNG